jgi:hypothetical protein
MIDFHTRFAEIAHWFETLTPCSLNDIEKIYSRQAMFRDPFNQVAGVSAVRQIYEHMFAQLSEPKFVITAKIVEDANAFMTWRFLFAARGKSYVIEGGTQLGLDAQGLIVIHRDYWDAAQELYEKLPVLGAILRVLRKKLSVNAV